MPIFITIRASTNSVYISDPNGQPVLGQAPYGMQLQDWQFFQPYTQKALYTDEILIMVHTQPGTNCLAYICDEQQHVIAGIDLTAPPYFKGKQTIPGNNDINPFDGTITALTTYLYAFKFGDFPGVITADGTYYIQVSNYSGISNSVTFYSEPIYLRSEHPNTSLWQCSFNSNVSDNTNVVVSGWYNDYPTNSIGYSPIFTVRCETYILPIDPKVINIGYLKQSYDQVQINGRFKRMKTLKVGEISIGIPDYMLEILTAFLLSDNLWIDGIPYVVFNPSAQTALSDIWKSKRDENIMLLKASTVIMEKYEAQGAMRTPTPTFPTRFHEAEFESQFD